MALPTLDDAKALLRIETDDEDDLIDDQLLPHATALIETFLGYPITAVERAHIDYAERDNAGVQPVLRMPGPFALEDDAPVVTDVNGTTVDDATYDLDVRGMKIRAKDGVEFPSRPYSILATIGLSAHPDYAATLEAVVSRCILALTSHLYLNRNPAMKAQTDEGGSGLTLSDDRMLDLVPELDLLPKQDGGWVFA